MLARGAGICILVAMKATKQNAIKLAERLGGRIEVSTDPDGQKLIEAIAPEGMQWVEGPTILTAQYGYSWGPAADAWSDIVERMDYGLEAAGE